jgi:SOS response associated peptidase (SRAP)
MGSHPITGKGDDAPFVFAGLWEGWKPPGSDQWLRTCTIIACEPNEFMATIRKNRVLFAKACDPNHGKESGEHCVKPNLIFVHRGKPRAHVHPTQRDSSTSLIHLAKREEHNFSLKIHYFGNFKTRSSKSPFSEIHVRLDVCHSASPEFAFNTI